MDEKPRRRRFRFGLISLFALVAVVGVLVCFWNPFPKPNRSNFGLIETGMTEADVARLVGKPDAFAMDNGRLFHAYHVNYGEEWFIVFVNGKVATSDQIWTMPVEPPPISSD